MVCVREMELGLVTASPPPLHPPPSHRTSAHKAQVCMLRNNCLDLSEEMLSILEGFNGSKANTLYDFDVHADKTQDEFKEAGVSAGGSLTVKPDLHPQGAVQLLYTNWRCTCNLESLFHLNRREIKLPVMENGHCTSILSTLSLSTPPTLGANEIAKVNWPPGCQGCKVSSGVALAETLNLHIWEPNNWSGRAGEGEQVL
eukprot:bmy_07419T0